MMFKLACFLAVAAVVSAGNIAAFSAAPIVTARSSQSIARNHNTLTAVPLAHTAPLPYYLASGPFGYAVAAAEAAAAADAAAFSPNVATAPVAAPIVV